MSMLTSPPAKIMLSSTSKVSLHDRFTKLEKTSVENPRVERAGVNKAGIKPASAKNRQLAIQMAKRPSVQAALRIKNKSIRQIRNANPNPRFGNKINNQYATMGLFKRIDKPRPVQARVSMGFDPSRLSIGGASFKAGGGSFNKPRNLAERLGVAGRMGNRIRRVGAGNGRGRFNLNRSFNKNQGGAININNSPKKGNKRFKAKRLGNNNQQNRGGFRKRGNNRNQTRRNQQKPQQPKTRENLDMDLDQYMAKSKSHLDADLDQYMAQSNTAGTN